MVVSVYAQHEALCTDSPPALKKVEEKHSVYNNAVSLKNLHFW